MTNQSRINIGLAFSIPSLLFSIWYAKHPEFYYLFYRVGFVDLVINYSIIPWIVLFIIELIVRQKKSPFMTPIPLFCAAYIALFTLFEFVAIEYKSLIKFGYYIGLEKKHAIPFFVLIYQLLACVCFVFLSFIPKKKLAEQVVAPDGE